MTGDPEPPDRFHCDNPFSTLPLRRKIFEAAVEQMRVLSKKWDRQKE
jgi:hypothetical protein